MIYRAHRMFYAAAEWNALYDELYGELLVKEQIGCPNQCYYLKRRSDVQLTAAERNPMF